MANLSTDTTAVPIFPIDEIDREYGERVLRARDGTSYGWRDVTSTLRKWRLTYECTQTHYASLMSFLDTQAGGYTRIFWNHPLTGETNIPIRVTPGSIRTSWENAAIRKVTFEIEQVL